MVRVFSIAMLMPRIIFVAILTVIWSIGASWYWTCKVRTACPEPWSAEQITWNSLLQLSFRKAKNTQVLYQDKPFIELEGQFLFNPGEYTCPLYIQQQEILDSLIRYLQHHPEKSLEITGTCQIGTEDNPSAFVNMGLARASFIEFQLEEGGLDSMRCIKSFDYSKAYVRPASFKQETVRFRLLDAQPAEAPAVSVANLESIRSDTLPVEDTSKWRAFPVPYLPEYQQLEMNDSIREVTSQMVRLLQSDTSLIFYLYLPPEIPLSEEVAFSHFAPKSLLEFGINVHQLYLTDSLPPEVEPLLENVVQSYNKPVYPGWIPKKMQQ